MNAASKKIGVVGASGRTGSYVVAALQSEVGLSRQLTLEAAIVSPNSSKLSDRLAKSEIYYTSDLSIIEQLDGVIDFSTPSNSLKVAEVCAQFKVPLLIGTTGFSAGENESLLSFSDRIPLAIVSNTSIGAHVLTRLAIQARQQLGDDFDIEVLDIHHRMKKDAPSGTALSLVRGVANACPDMPELEIVSNRGHIRGKNQIGIASLRGGGVVGDHTIYFLGDSERLELSHKVNDRSVFGGGAVVFMKHLLTKSTGIYSASELLFGP